MVRELRTPVDELKSYLRARGEAVQKLQLFVKDPSCRPAVMAELERRFPGIAASTSLANNIELNDAAANKGTRCVRWQRILGSPWRRRSPSGTAATT